MKQVLTFFLLLLLPVLLFAQQRDTTIVLKDTTTGGVKDTTAGVKKDTSVKVLTVHPVVITYDAALQKILKQNCFLNASGKPFSFQNRIKNQPTDDLLFYILAGVVFLLAVFSFVYKQYFNNLFRVFSNTPLRQSHLTNQLLQATLPSLLFNSLFAVTGGIYTCLVFRYYRLISPEKTLPIMLFCIMGVSLIYFAKFLSLKFTGWLSGYSEITNTYLFVIFLINKVAGILLLPFVVVIAFSDQGPVSIAVAASFLFIGLLLVLRFYRSFGLLKNLLKIDITNFLLYIAGLEVVPLLLIYKSLMILLSKNL